MAKSKNNRGYWILGLLLLVGGYYVFRPRKKVLPKLKSIPVSEDETVSGGGIGGGYGGGFGSVMPTDIQTGDVVDQDGNKIPDAVDQDAIDQGTPVINVIPIKPPIVPDGVSAPPPSPPAPKDPPTTPVVTLKPTVQTSFTPTVSKNPPTAPAPTSLAPTSPTVTR